MLKVKRSGDFEKMLKNLTLENSQLLTLIEKKILLFKKNSEDSRLDNHSLTKRMEGKFAFSITNDVRIIYKWTGDTTVRFLAIGHHKMVYKKSS